MVQFAVEAGQRMWTAERLKKMDAGRSWRDLLPELSGMGVDALYHRQTEYGRQLRSETNTVHRILQTSFSSRIPRFHVFSGAVKLPDIL